MSFVDDFITLLVKAAKEKTNQSEMEALRKQFLRMMSANNKTPKYGVAEVGTDSDKLDGQHGSYYRDASNINAGTLPTDRFSAYADLTAETKIGAGAEQVAAGDHTHAGSGGDAPLGLVVQGVNDGDATQALPFNWQTIAKAFGAIPTHTHETDEEGGGLSGSTYALGSITRYGSNPIIAKGAGGDWDDTDALNMSVVRISPTEYHAIYSGFDGTIWQTGHASSPDGITWTKNSPNVPVIAVGAAGWDKLGATNGTTIFFKGKWYHFYQGLDEDNTKWQIGFATADTIDGAWTKYASNPVLTGLNSGWEGVHVGDPFVMVHDGLLWLFYESGPGTTQEIGIATSPDGVTWTRYASNPVVEVGGVGDFDEGKAAAPYVFKLGPTWYMFYLGSDGSDLRTIGMATSPDLVTWTKYGSNPIMEAGTGWEAGDLTDPEVLVEGNQLTIFYGGGTISGATTINGQIGRATQTITITQPFSKVKVSANDTTPGVLNGKLVAGANITFTEGSDGGNETLTIAAAVATGEILIQDGSSAPPVMLTNEAEDDFLYEG